MFGKMAGLSTFHGSLYTQLPVILILHALIFDQCGKYAAAQTKISCLSCHVESYPFYGCLDLDDVTLEQIADGTGEGSSLYYRGMDVVNKCETCGIEDTWHRKSGKFLQRRKLCFVTNVTSSGCAYKYPTEGEEVKEVCYCNTDLCNLRDIASLGGSHDVKKFPTVEPYQKEVSKATREISGRDGFGMLILAFNFLYF